MANVKVTICLMLASQLLWPAVGTAQDDGPVGLHNSEPMLDMGNLEELNEELRRAAPLPAPEVEAPNEDWEGGEWESLPSDEIPGYAPGWEPGNGPMPDPTDGYIIDEDHPLYPTATGQATVGSFGAAPSNPRDGPYAPYQRWTWYGRYLTYPTSTIGRLFFDTTGDGTRNASCSASVISGRTIATAGHCIKNGSGAWYSRFLFCPSYNQSGVNPSRGCWDWTFAATTPGWASGGQLDRDIACIVTAQQGTSVSATVGSQTGWTGRAWNWASQQPTFVFGYPANDDFPGYHIIAGSSTEWYEVNMTSGDGQLSKYIGGDQHSGNSGGPWWLSLAHRNKEWPAVDNTSTTDPFQPTVVSAFPGPYLNGVYSHKRCTGGSCASPPGTGSGMFWNEMGAAQFRSTSGDLGESEDVFAHCFSNE